MRVQRRDGWVGSGGVSASLSFTLGPGLITLVNLAGASGGRLKLIATEVDIVDTPAFDLETPHFKIRPSTPVSQFLSRYSEEGGSHHLAMAYGAHAGAVEKVAKLQGLPFARI